MQINQNIAALNAYRNLTVTNGQMGRSLEKLSSGFRINRAADDAAGLAISEGLRSQVGGLKMAVRNAQDGVSVVQTAEGALTEVHAILQRVRDLAVQGANSGANGGTGSTAVNALQAEVDELAQALTDIANRTNFNGTQLLDGTNATLTFHVGSNTADTLSVSLTDISAVATAVAGLTIGDAAAIDAVDTQVTTVSTARATLGAAQNRLEHTINSLNVAIENLSASESRIRDTDMAQEMVAFTRAQILTQAGTAMLAQANAAPQSVLQLLR